MINGTPCTDRSSSVRRPQEAGAKTLGPGHRREHPV